MLILILSLISGSVVVFSFYSLCYLTFSRSRRSVSIINLFLKQHSYYGYSIKLIGGLGLQELIDLSIQTWLGPILYFFSFSFVYFSILFNNINVSLIIVIIYTIVVFLINLYYFVIFFRFVRSRSF